MLAFCVGTLLAGALGATFVPFLPFLAVVTIAATLGAAIAAAQGRLELSVLTTAVILLCCTQIGFALGLAGLSFEARRRAPKPVVDTSTHSGPASRDPATHLAER